MIPKKEHNSTVNIWYINKAVLYSHYNSICFQICNNILFAIFRTFLNIYIILNKCQPFNLLLIF